MKNGWLVNDCLTCIPGTKTFWNDLLEWIPGLYDMCGGYTDYSVLPQKIEKTAFTDGAPDYIIRNATFFRRLNVKTKTISLLQDHYTGNNRIQQIDVCKHSDVTIFNSPYTKSLYPEITDRYKIIPIGVDFLHFNIDYNKEQLRAKYRIKENSVLYVGSQMDYPKGFNTVLELINSTEYNFVLVMKDDFKIDHPRVRVFNTVNHDTMKDIYNACSMLVCTSKMETLHLSGIEAAACGLPLVVTRVGAYCNLEDGEWGYIANSVQDFKLKIDVVLNNRDIYNGRKFFQSLFDKEHCRKSWQSVVNEI